MLSKFIQIHTLTSYAAALLNRDDAGFAKRLPFGGVTRTRVSSQCLKRHWRTFDGEGSLDELDVPGTVRSRRTFEKYVVQPLLHDGLSEGAVRCLTEAIMEQVLGQSAKAKEKKKSEEEESGKAAGLHTSQVTVLGHPEIGFIKDLVATLCEGLDGDGKKLQTEASKRVKEALSKEGKKNLQSMKLAGGLGAALFGRMVTSDILARADAAIHVAHAFTVHEQDTEDDYFSAIDDLVQEAGEQGSGHINSTELTSGLFYGYVVVDVPLLVSNLSGCHRKEWLKEDRTLAGDIVARLLGLMTTVSPGAKLGSTAPYARAQLVMVETDNAQPRTLANAFLKPVVPAGDVIGQTFQTMSNYIEDMDNMYPFKGERTFSAMGPADMLKCKANRLTTVDDIKSWACAQVVGGNA